MLLEMFGGCQNGVHNCPGTCVFRAKYLRYEIRRCALQLYDFSHY